MASFQTLSTSQPRLPGWADYLAHPVHKAYVRDFVTPLQASRLTIQF